MNFKLEKIIVGVVKKYMRKEKYGYSVLFEALRIMMNVFIRKVYFKRLV